MAIKQVQIKGYLFLLQFPFFLQTVHFLATHILTRNLNNFTMVCLTISYIYFGL